MRKRNCRMEVYFTKDELALAEKKAKKAGLSREGFARAAMLGHVVREAPSADTRQMLWELRRSGANLNQALKKLNAVGLADIPMLTKASEEVYNAARAIATTFAKPDV